MNGYTEAYSLIKQLEKLVYKVIMDEEVVSHLREAVAIATTQLILEQGEVD